MNVETARQSKSKKCNPPYANLSTILFLLRPPPWKKFRCCETSRRSQCLLMALCPYQYVEVDNFLHLHRWLTVSQFSSWALCVQYQYLKPVWREASSEADSGHFRATYVDDASNVAAFSSPKNDREMAGEVDVDSYGLFAPEAESG